MLNNLKRSKIAQHFTNTKAKKEENTIKMTVCGRRCDINFNPPWDSRSWWSLIVNTRSNPRGCPSTVLLSDTHLHRSSITRIRCTTLLMHICTYCSFVQQLTEGLGATSQTTFCRFSNKTHPWAPTCHSATCLIIRTKNLLPGLVRTDIPFNTEWLM